MNPVNGPATGDPGDLFPTPLLSPAADSVVFTTLSSPLPGLPGSNGVVDLYRAQRTPLGWATTALLSPSGAQATAAGLGAVSADHRYSFFNLVDRSPLTSLAAGSYLAGPDGDVAPIGQGALGTEPDAHGRYISPDSQQIIFTTGRSPGLSPSCSAVPFDCDVLQLEPDAPPSGTGAVYGRGPNGEVHVLSLLPGEITPAAGEEARYMGTSLNADSVAFAIGGTLYARIQIGDPARERTLTVSSGGPSFAGLSAEGRYLFYRKAGDIHRFDTATDADDQLTHTADARIVNLSADGSHAYFISEERINGAGTVSQPNLYAWSEDSTTYVATVATGDLLRTSGDPSAPAPGLTRWPDIASDPADPSEEALPPGPGADSSRTTPDGEVLVFESRAALTGYDNQGHTEIYRWDNRTRSLLCLTCNELVSSASADAHLEQLATLRSSTVVGNLSNDGSRVFFETAEALVAADTDAANDVYEWEQGTAGARLSLISSGQSALSNLLLAVSADGDDVVFLTQDALLPGAPQGGASQIYDARVDGGFGGSAASPECFGEACPPRQGTLRSPPRLRSEATRPLKKRAGRRHRRRCHRDRQRRRHCPHRRAHQRPSTIGSSPFVEAVGSNGGLASSQNEDSSFGIAQDSDLATEAAIGDYGIESVSARDTSPAAGAATDFTTKIVIKHTGGETHPRQDARTERVSVSLPPGLTAYPGAVPRCQAGELVALDCPLDSQVGVVTLQTDLVPHEITEPLYDLQPPHPDDEVARFGFIGISYPVFIDIHVRSASDYGIDATATGLPGALSLIDARVTIWGDPADPVHDAQRLTPAEAEACSSGIACMAGGSRPSGLPPSPFLVNPLSCGRLTVGVSISSYQLPEESFDARVNVRGVPGGPTPISSCSGVPFDPNFDIEPTNDAAGGPTGLRAEFELPRSGGGSGAPAAGLRGAVITLPAGMQLAPGIASSVGTCSDRQVGLHEEIAARCPGTARIGSATLSSPTLPGSIPAAIYLRAPAPGRQFGLWMVADAFGLHVKVPAELQVDPASGRLTIVFDDLPQVPLGKVAVELWGGPGAPLQNPDTCGTYLARYTFFPYSEDPGVSGQRKIAIERACHRPFSPAVRTGVDDAKAGASSPFIFDLGLDEGEQALGSVALSLAPGQLAHPVGISLCPEAQAVSGACPLSSQIGHLALLVGRGPEPLSIPARGSPGLPIYLAGPYQGAPFSITTAIPARAGAFDLGSTAIRAGLAIDPVTAAATIRLDGFPQLLGGVRLQLRELHIVLNRAGFIRNPTNCAPMSIRTTATALNGPRAELSTPFQVHGCGALAFRPRVVLGLAGGIGRGGHPALRVALSSGPHQATTAKAGFTLPAGELLDLQHLRALCSPGLPLERCPAGSRIGWASIDTPFLSDSLEGPIYLRQPSDRQLPNLLADLHGDEVRLLLHGRVAAPDGRLLIGFDALPDVPIDKALFKFIGGRRGIVVNSEPLCGRKPRAGLDLIAQSGRRLHRAVPIRLAGC